MPFPSGFMNSSSRGIHEQNKNDIQPTPCLSLGLCPCGIGGDVLTLEHSVSKICFNFRIQRVQKCWVGHINRTFHYRWNYGDLKCPKKIKIVKLEQEWKLNYIMRIVFITFTKFSAQTVWDLFRYRAKLCIRYRLKKKKKIRVDVKYLSVKPGKRCGTLHEK